MTESGSDGLGKKNTKSSVDDGQKSAKSSLKSNDGLPGTSTKSSVDDGQKSAKSSLKSNDGLPGTSTKSSVRVEAPPPRAEDARGSGGLAILDRVFSTKNLDDDIKAKDVTRPRDIAQQVVTFPLGDDLQERLHLRKNPFLALGAVSLVTVIVLFIVFYAVNSTCTATTVLSLSPQGTNCRTSQLVQNSVVSLDLDGVFSNQPGFNIKRGLYSLKYVNFQGTDEDFRRETTAAMRQLRERTAQLPVLCAWSNLEELMALSVETDTIVARWDFDPPQLLRSRHQTIDNILVFEDEDLMVKMNPSNCSVDFERLVVSTVYTVANTAENYNSFRLEFMEQDDPDALADPPIFRVPAGGDACANDNERVTESALRKLYDLLEPTPLASGRRRLELGFDAQQAFVISRCNRRAAAEDLEPCEGVPINGEPSRGGYVLAFSESLGEYGFTYTTRGADGGALNTVFVVASIRPHPGIPECSMTACPEAGEDSDIVETCQRNAAVLLKYYLVGDDVNDLTYEVSTYFIIQTRDIWNRLYTTEFVHCNLDRMLVPVVNEDSLSAPFPTDSGVFECEITICKSVLERLGTAQAAAELFFIIFLFTVLSVYLLVQLVRVVPSGGANESHQVFILKALSDSFLDPDLRDKIKRKWLKLMIAFAFLAATVATFVCFLVIPEACQTTEFFSLNDQTSTENKTTCDDVLVTNNRATVMDSDQVFDGQPGFFPGSAFFSMVSRDYQADEERLNSDLAELKSELNTKLSALVPADADSVVKHETLLFTEMGSSPGLALRFHAENAALGALSSPDNVIVTIASDTEGCVATYSAELQFSRVRPLNADSPLFAAALRDPEAFFGVGSEEYDDTSCFPNEQQFNLAHNELIDNFARVFGDQGLSRVELFMPDFIKVDACNRDTIRDDCVRLFANARSDVIYVPDIDRYGLMWSVTGEENFIAVPRLQSACLACTTATTSVCDRYDLEVQFWFPNGGDLALFLDLAFTSDLPLNGLGAAPRQRCSYGDVLLDVDQQVAVPFSTSSGLFFCSLEVCSTWISRVASSFADTDFVFEIFEVILAVILVTVAIVGTRHGTLNNFAELLMKPVPARTRNLLSRAFTIVLSMFILLSFIGFFVGFFVRFGECETASVLVDERTDDESCQQALLRQDGRYPIDQNGLFQTEEGHKAETAAFRLAFRGYRNNERQYREDLNTLLDQASELFTNLTDRPFVDVYPLLLATPIRIGGQAGEMILQANVYNPFFVRWTNLAPERFDIAGEQAPLETFWFVEEDVSRITRQQLENCDINQLFRCTMVEEETETLIKYIRVREFATPVEQGTCMNGEATNNHPGRELLRSFMGDPERNMLDIADDFHVSFDSAQVFGLHLCNQDPEPCIQRVRPGGEFARGRDEVFIPVSWETFPSVYDQESGRFGYVWTTGNTADNQDEYYFVQPMATVSDECLCGVQSNAQFCSSELLLILKFYRLEEGQPLEYVASFAKEMDLTGLWNSVGVSYSLHCNMGELVSLLDGPMRRIVTDSAVPFQSQINVFECEETWCTPGTERFGDAYALSKLLIIIMLFLIVFISLLAELHYSRRPKEAPKAPPTFDMGIASSSGTEVSPETSANGGKAGEGQASDANV